MLRAEGPGCGEAAPPRAKPAFGPKSKIMVTGNHHFLPKTTVLEISAPETTLLQKKSTPLP